ncbi:ABC transporter substrate-binding protein [Cohnella silvisoli]|uniref:Extracellular solute-binding protein n=1 Tax=Cohnella silvisoli TaxID=2873699 RepID=A0ABV1KSC1_9BACL|nr:extracellular solute-binding protein [Cohnella silvisoli]MCD9022652.1 extracellular solute-binding protein [Cohnella silvisoli]
MKRFKALWITLLILAFGVAGCGTSKNNATNSATADTSASVSQSASPSESQSASPAEKVKIRMAYWNKESTVQNLLDLIKQKLPNIELEYQFIENSQYDNIVGTQLAAGSGPDIISIGPPAASQYSKLGYLADLSTLADRFNEAGTSVYSVDGKLVALPGISWFEGIYYNKEIFAKYGLKAPTTFEEELQLHEDLKKNGIKPQAMGAKSFEPMMKSSMGLIMNEFLSLPENKDFDVKYGKGEITLEGNWNAGLEKWSELIKRGYLTKDMLGIDYDQALDEFATGKAAMWESGPWALDTIKQKNPNIQLDMFPFYGSKPGPGWLIGGPGVGFSANANSKHLDAVMQVMDLIATTDGQKAFWENNQGGSSYLKGADFEMPAEFDGVKETFKAGNVYAPWNNWGGNVSGVIQDYGKSLQELLGGKSDVSSVLKATDKQTARIIKLNP